MNNFYKPFLLLLFFSALLIGSCNRVCDPGYEGNHCTTEIRAKYLGGFNGSLACSNGNNTDSVTITPNTGDVTKVNFRNINNAGVNTLGVVQTDGTIGIASQNLGGNTITGLAKVVSGKINIVYTVNDTIACTWIQN